MKIKEQGIVSRITDSFFSYHAWPSACTDENGNIYVVCSGMRMGHMCPFGKIVMFISVDDGKTFSLPIILNDSYLDDRDPGLLYLGNGEMLLTRCSHPASVYENDFIDWIKDDSGDAGEGLVKCYKNIPDAQRDGGCYYRKLFNYGNVKGEENKIPVHSPHGPILLKDKSIFYLGKELFANDVFSVYVSSDNGETFVKTGECPIPDEYEKSTFHEVHCAELENGSVIALFRSHLTDDDSYFTIMKTVTKDRGKTWSEWEKTGICGSPPHLFKMKNGNFTLTYGRRIPPYGIYARNVDKNGVISDIEIKLTDCSDSDIGYPATIQTSEGDLLTFYYARLGDDCTASILYTKWTPD